MRQLAEFVMRGRKQAVLTALLFSVLPFLGWVADIIMLLVTLRKGAKEGAFVLIWILLPGIIVALNGYPQIWIYGIIGGSVFSYGLAVVLRQTMSWAIVLQLAALVGMVAVIIVHFYFPNIAEFWQTDIRGFIATAQKSLELPELEPTVLQNWVNWLARVATGAQAAILLLGDLINLAIARWLQAILYNPHGLRVELHHIRLGKIAIVVLLLTFIAIFLGNKTGFDCLLLAIMPFMLAGLSLVHFMAATSRTPWLWLIGFYCLFVVFFIYFSISLITFALMDCWWDFRKRLSER